MKTWLDLLKSRTIWAGIGLWGLAIYQLTHGQAEGAAQSFLGGLAAWGLRVAVDTPPAVREVPATPAESVRVFDADGRPSGN